MSGSHIGPWIQVLLELSVQNSGSPTYKTGASLGPVPTSRGARGRAPPQGLLASGVTAF